MRITLEQLGEALNIGLGNPISCAYILGIINTSPNIKRLPPTSIEKEIKEQMTEPPVVEKTSDKKVQFIADLKMLKSEFAETPAQRRVLDNLIKKVENP